MPPYVTVFTSPTLLTIEMSALDHEHGVNADVP
jgi:hypothetical protein